MLSKVCCSRTKAISKFVLLIIYIYIDLVLATMNYNCHIGTTHQMHRIYRHWVQAKKKFEPYVRVCTFIKYKIWLKEHEKSST